MNEYSKHFGNRLRELRKEKQMSQEALALKSSISPAHLGQIERGQKSPTLTTIYDIAAGLDVPVTALFSDEITPKVQVSPTPILEKIEIQLLDLSELQQQELLRLIRIVKNFSKEK